MNIVFLIIHSIYQKWMNLKKRYYEKYKEKKIEIKNRILLPLQMQTIKRKYINNQSAAMPILLGSDIVKSVKQQSNSCFIKRGIKKERKWYSFF